MLLCEIYIIGYCTNVIDWIDLLEVNQGLDCFVALRLLVSQ